MTIALLGVSSGPSVPPSVTAIAPPQAAAVGFDQLTFGPAVTIGQNWYLWNLLAQAANSANSIQNGDGSVTCCPPGSSNQIGCLCTAQQVGSNWSGTTFGGGFYAEAKIAFTPTLGSTNVPFPAFWCNDIDFLAVVGSLQWPGQAAGYNHFVEFDMFQWIPTTVSYYAAAGVIDWYGNPVTAGVSQPVNPLTQVSQNSFVAPLTLADYNTYGCLWVPATATTQGFVRSFFNDSPVEYTTGNPIVWNLYNPSNAPPPIAGSTAASRLDIQTQPLILSSRPGCPMQVASVRVWQSSTAGNVVQ